MLRRNGPYSVMRGRQRQDWPLKAANRRYSRRQKAFLLESIGSFVLDDRMKFDKWKSLDK